MQAALDSIVCHTPLSNLGFSRKGSALTFSVAFQALRAGLFEVGQGAAAGLGGTEGEHPAVSPSKVRRVPKSSPVLTCIPTLPSP